ncbi:MAG: flagellar biosynthesis protein FlhB [Ilumatobacter sp.]
MSSKQDKTEAPTPKKKRESRRKGEIARSQDLTAWGSVLIALYLLPMTVGQMASVFDASMQQLSTMPSTGLAAEDTPALLGSSLRAGFMAVGLLFFAGFASSLLVSFAQTGPMLALKPLVPDFKRVNPKNGFKRLFSARSLWETAKQLIKVSVIIGAAWPRASGLVDRLVGPDRPLLWEGLTYAGQETLAVARIVVWSMLLVAAADYGYQKYKHGQDQKMTRQEVRDENKNAEGDQHMKGRMRSLQMGVARNRMIADVGQADVIITNPTHIAVALRYDFEQGGAPKVLAVGAGNVAAKIRAAGVEHSVAMVEAKPLARALWRSCEVGDEVPVALYEAVAKVLVFVRRLDKRLRRSTPIDLPPASRVDTALLESIPAKKGARRRA